jgi:hypothetical protein
MEKLDEMILKLEEDKLKVAHSANVRDQINQKNEINIKKDRNISKKIQQTI